MKMKSITIENIAKENNIIPDNDDLNNYSNHLFEQIMLDKSRHYINDDINEIKHNLMTREIIIKSGIIINITKEEENNKDMYIADDESELKQIEEDPTNNNNKLKNSNKKVSRPSLRPTQSTTYKIRHFEDN